MSDWNEDGAMWTIRRIAELEQQLERLGELSLKATQALGYLDGMVARGRGSAIDPDDITANVAGYIKELEQQLAELRTLAQAVIDNGYRQEMNGGYDPTIWAVDLEDSAALAAALKGD